LPNHLVGYLKHMEGGGWDVSLGRPHK
jgi:hypothetical protein